MEMDNDVKSLEGRGRLIKRAIGFPNGMMMVFDWNGQQMPEFQGRTVEMIPKIRAAGFKGDFDSGDYR